MTERSTAGVRIFAFGIVVGLLTATFLIGVAGLVLVQRGITVPISRETMINELTAQAEAALQTAIPQMLAQARGQMPQIVKEQVRSGLGEMSLEIANYQVKLPAAVVSRIDGFLQATVTSAFGELLRGLEANAGQALSHDQVRLQAVHWADGLDGKRFVVETRLRISIPVSIRLD
ncbi:MAG: hypothetical protein ACM3ZQ_09420 [Bacillota bacterium]